MYCSHAFGKGFLAIDEPGDAGSYLMAKTAEPGGLVYSCLASTSINLEEALGNFSGWKFFLRGEKFAWRP